MRACSLLAAIAVVGICFAGGAGNAAEDFTISIKVAPHVIVLNSGETIWLTVHTNINYYAVEPGSVEINGIDLAWATIDDRGNYVAKFYIDEIKAIAEVPSIELVLTGATKLGVPFSGSEVVEVKTGKKK